MNLKRTVARLALFSKLWTLATQKGIIVAWSFSKLRATSRSRSKEDIIGLYYYDHKMVLLGSGHFLDPYTLAHELGHHELRRKKHTELDADRVAREIIENFSSDVSLALLQGEMDENLPVVEG